MSATPTGYENKVLTGDKLVTLVGLIKGELANKLSTTQLGQALDNYFGTNGISLYDDANEETYQTTINPDGIQSTATLDGEITHAAGWDNAGFWAGYNDTVGDKRYAAEFNSEAIIFNVYDTSGAEEELIDSVAFGLTEDGTIDITGTVTLDGHEIALAEDIPSIPEIPDELADLTDDSTHRLVTDAEKTAWSGKQDALVFNTAYNASSNKVATMSDVSGKQDALVFNTAYNASSNKVATMADIPSVSAFQTASDVQTAITTALSGITSFSFEIVQALPQSNISQTTIYLVLKSSGPSGNIYTEYAYVKTGTDAQTGNDVYGWEILGDTQADIATLSTSEVNILWQNTPADGGM